MLTKANHHRAHSVRLGRESGQVVVLFALLIPVILAFGSLIVSGGNWYVLKRHLQTQVDAAALAGGPAFSGCSQDPVGTNTKIAQQALQYSGDTLRNVTTPYNLQLEQAGDQRVVLNSSLYWSQGDVTDGSTLDNTLGTPCNTKFLDVKATDDRAPLLFKWLPLFPSLKSRALVEIHKVEGTNGLRPLGVPEVDPVRVAVLFINEDDPGGINAASAIVGKSDLDFWDPTLPSPPPPELADMAAWHKDVSGVNLNGNENYSAVVVASRDPGMSLTGSLKTICTQNPTQTHCYGPGTTLQQGISFIHSYSDAGGGGTLGAKVRQVELAGGCGTVSSPYESNPYFNVDDGTSCNAILVQAKIDFGVSGTPTGDPTCAQAFANGSAMAWSAGGIGGTLGTWTTTITPTVASGRNVINITTKGKQTGSVKIDCSQRSNGASFPRVAVPYVADDDSGVVQYIRLDNLKSPFGLANSINGNGALSDIRVTVGLTPPLRDAALTDPPIPLRFWDTPSQSQALDCANGASGWNNAMQNGCPDPYQIYDQAKHVSACGNPPSGVQAADPEDCISSKNGNFQQKGVTDLLDDCAATPNNWNRNGFGVPPPQDPRWMPLFILDELAFQQSGKKTYPIRRFGMFYITSVSGLNCPGDDPFPAPSGKRSMFGHFLSYVTPGFGDTIADDQLCSFTDGGLCVSGLVE
jgi:hypothetical protein